MDKLNYTMLCDFYELTMGNGYFVSGMKDRISYFDLFFRYTSEKQIEIGQNILFRSVFQTCT